MWLTRPMQTPTTIDVHGPALREIRVRSGMSVAELATAIDVQRPYITKLELGHSRRVSPRVFNAIISALAISDRRAIMAHPYGASDEMVDAA